MAELGLARLDEIMARHGDDPGKLIPVLQDTQRAYGYLPETAMQQIAEGLGIPLSKVFGVATFYSLFATAPKGKHIVRLCESAPCHVRGAEEVRAALVEELGVEPGSTTADGLFTLEYTSCLGVCGVAPAMMIGDVVYGNLTPVRAREIVAGFRQAAAAAGQ